MRTHCDGECHGLTVTQPSYKSVPTAGTFTLSASAVSYQTTTQQVTLSGNTRVDIVLQRVPSTATPTPAPGPTPGTASLQITIDPVTCLGKVFVASVAVDGTPPMP